MAKSSVILECAESADAHVFRNFPDSCTMAVHHHSVHFDNDLAISACQWPTGAWLALHRCAGVFKSVVPLLNLCAAHSLVTENRLDLSNCLWCSTRSVIFFAMKSQREHCALPYPNAACQRLTLLAGRKKFTHAPKGLRGADASALVLCSSGDCKKKKK